MKRHTFFIMTFVLGFCFSAQTNLAQQKQIIRSHPPLRKAPPPSKRAMAEGPAFFADAKNGDDQNKGDKASPWGTIQHALGQMKSGDTLYLRGGVYYENVHVALEGKENTPITIRSFPGEQAIIDGAFAEFFQSPQESWQRLTKGDPNEFRSTKRHPNLRNVVGSLGDSMIGLQTYYHAKDFRAANELVDWEDWDNRDKTDLKSLYLGPGLWYDKETGYIHSRLAHTHVPGLSSNYEGEIDPRRLPLVIAPLRSIPLHVDGAKHIRFQDLIIRGGGYATIKLDQASHIEFDNVTVWCGTYGIRSMGTGPLKFHNSALYGNVAPWTFRGDGSKRDYPGRPHRNISRLNTHALLDINSGRESSVYATPYNDHWEISHSEFTDAHDALYLGAINVKFHHNRVVNMQDDGIYLSPMYTRHRLEQTDPKLYIYQNEFRQVLTALAFGGPQPKTDDTVYIYRNIFDLRAPVNTGRPSVKTNKPGFHTGRVMGDHGSPPWSAMMIYHNTFVMAAPARKAPMETFGHTAAKHPRRVFNNIFFHFARLPGYPGPDPNGNVVADGNLYFSPMMKASQAVTFFKRFRASKPLEQSKSLYPPGSASHSLVANPLFVKAAVESKMDNDYRLQPKSRAIDAGVLIPADWPDPLRQFDKGQSDIGALPLGAQALAVGRNVELAIP